MKRRHQVALTAILPVFLISMDVYAAELEEIIVTAQRKAESLQDVPIAVSALTTDTIEKTDTHNLSGIAVQVPGLTFSSFSPGQNIVSLRGAGSNDDGAGTDSSVAIFVDDVYLGRISNINPDLFDLERIEVLRGPQGTLYGKNTIGGAINIVSTRPSFDQIEGKVKVGVGNYNSINVAGLVTGPLSENLAFKVAGNFRKRDGWVDNVVLNKEQKDDNTSGFKAQLLYAGDRVEGSFRFDYNDLDVEDMGRIPLRANYDGVGPGGPNPALFRGPYNTACGDRTDGQCLAGPIDGYAKREAWGVSGKLTFNLTDTMDLISISAYRESEADWNMDSIGSPALPVNDDIFDTTEQLSQEFRLSDSPSDRVNYVVGAWLLSEKTDRTECFDLNGGGPAGSPPAAGADYDSATPGTDCTPLNDGSEGYRQDNETTSYAVFAQVDLALHEKLKLTLGGRYSYEKKEIVSTAVTNRRLPGFAPDITCNSRNVPASMGMPARPVNATGLCIIAQNFGPLSVDEDWSAFTPKVSLSFQPSENINLYATYAEGFKSGGFAAAPQDEAAARRTLDQEEATNYEVGFKGLFNNIFRLNVSFFHTEYEGLQIQNFGSPAVAMGQTASFGRFLTFNAGDAEIQGIELEGVLLIGNNLTLSSFLSLNDSEFGTTNIENSAANANQDGNNLLRTPELKYGVTIDYVIPFPGGSALNLTGSYNYSDDQRGDLPSYAVQPEFALVDFRAGWTNAGETLEITAWMKNVLDEAYVSHIYTIAGGNVTGIYGDPRTFGISGTYHF